MAEFKNRHRAVTVHVPQALAELDAGTGLKLC